MARPRRAPPASTSKPSIAAANVGAPARPSAPARRRASLPSKRATCAADCSSLGGPVRRPSSTSSPTAVRWATTSRTRQRGQAGTGALSAWLVEHPDQADQAGPAVAVEARRGPVPPWPHDRPGGRIPAPGTGRWEAGGVGTIRDTAQRRLGRLEGAVGAATGLLPGRAARRDLPGHVRAPLRRRGGHVRPARPRRRRARHRDGQLRRARLDLVPAAQVLPGGPLRGAVGPGPRRRARPAAGGQGGRRGAGRDRSTGTPSSTTAGPAPSTTRSAGPPRSSSTRCSREAPVTSVP